MQDSEAFAQNAVRELEEAASRLRAAELHLAEESELRSSTEQRAAELNATLRSHEAEKAAYEAKVMLVIKNLNKTADVCVSCATVHLHTC